jgi:hypothetical protein
MESIHIPDPLRKLTNHQEGVPTTTQQNSQDESDNSETLSPQMAEYWKHLQAIAQEFGVTATLVPQKKVPPTTTKTRFIFLAG